MDGKSDENKDKRCYPFSNFSFCLLEVPQAIKLCTKVVFAPRYGACCFQLKVRTTIKCMRITFNCNKDIYWMWIVHMLHPHAYGQLCETKFGGMILRPENIASLTEHREATQLLWKETFGEDMDDPRQQVKVNCSGLLASVMLTSKYIQSAKSWFMVQENSVQLEPLVVFPMSINTITVCSPWIIHLLSHNSST